MNKTSVFFCKQLIHKNAAVVLYCAVIITTHERLLCIYNTFFPLKEQYS